MRAIVLLVGKWPMLIRQFQFINISDEEIELIPDFCEFLCQTMFEKIDTKINRRKIQLRISYLYKVPWIEWKRNEVIGVKEIMKSIFDSFSYDEYKNNIWKIYTNSNVYIPNTYTLMDRLIRFLDFGDMNYHATGMFSTLKKEYNAKKLNTLWQIFIMNRLGNMSDVEIITD